MALIEELKRRRVFRVAGLYLVAAWIIAEVSDVVFPALGLPDWTITFVILLLLFGFPLAMILAWVFDVGPEGVQRTEPRAAAQRALRGTRAKLAYGGLLVAGLAILAFLLFAPWKQWTGAPPGGRSSIAVLPFANLSGDEKNDYFSDGMSEELINLLTRVPGLQVAARTSSFAYKERSVNVRTVADELAVETVLEGSVRWAGDRVRITAQLIDAETGYHLWSDTYDERLENIFDVQDRIARAIVDALEVTLAGAEDQDGGLGMPAAPTRDVQAYDQYLKARDIVRRRGERNIRLALDLFQAAVGRDPGFAQAYAGLATAYVLLPTYTDDAMAPALELASEAAVQALTLDAGLAEAHAVLALINQFEWNWTDAEAGFFAATGLQPGEPTPHHWYSQLLRAAGRLERALEAATTALELDPDSAVLNASLAAQYMLLGDDARAAELAAEAERLGYGEKLGDLRAIAALRRGDFTEATAGLIEGGALFGLTPPLAERFAGALLEPSSRADFLAELETIDMPVSARLALLLSLDARDEVFAAAAEILETSRTDLPVGAFWLPEAAGIRSDPRFVELMTKVGLPDYWRRYGWSDFCAPEGEEFTCW